MNLNTEGEEVPIWLDPEVATSVTRLGRQFGIRDESELFEWMVTDSGKRLDQKLDGKEVLIRELTKRGEKPMEAKTGFPVASTFGIKGRDSGWG